MTIHPRRRFLVKHDPHDRIDKRKDNHLLVVRDSEVKIAVDDLWVRVPGTVMLGFDFLRPEILHRVNPDVVITALVSRSFDCTDVANVLCDAEFTGEFRIVCSDIPQPELIVEELRRSFPALDIDILPLTVKPTAT